MTALAASSWLLMSGCGLSRIEPSVETPSIQLDEAEPVAKASTAQPAVTIAQKASQLQMGMTYQEVVELLGRMPSTVHNDEILRELGEPVTGDNLTTFEWKNDDPACYSVAVDFNSSGMTTGWNEGVSCPGASIFNEPLGKDCAETTLCKL